MQIKPGKSKAQSAMEYLMTYSWSILVIAIVLGALFALGVFNSANFAPKANPGACQVYRPYGSGSSASANLEGECLSLLPQFVAQFSGSEYLTLPSLMFGYPTSGATNNYELTVSAWFKTAGSGGVFAQDDGSLPPGTPSGYVPAIYIDSNGHLRSSLFWHGSTSSQITTQTAYDDGKWHHVVDTYSNGVETLYVDGQLVNSLSNVEYSYSSNYAYFIGTGYASGWPYANGWMYLNGMISNVQIYNTALDSASVNALYQEGIGGVPVDLQNLVAWWPLNGNANDYSGKGNNGQAVRIAYTTSWTSGYTTP